MNVVDSGFYEFSCNQLVNNIIEDFDCIVCLKRSGFILGAFLSNKFDKPLYTINEATNIPKKFTKVLLVDDKIYSGKTIRNAKNKIISNGFKVITASLFIEGNIYTDYHVHDFGYILKMWYE